MRHDLLSEDPLAQVEPSSSPAVLSTHPAREFTRGVASVVRESWCPSLGGRCSTSHGLSCPITLRTLLSAVRQRFRRRARPPRSPSVSAARAKRELWARSSSELVSSKRPPAQAPQLTRCSSIAERLDRNTPLPAASGPNRGLSAAHCDGHSSARTLLNCQQFIQCIVQKKSTYSHGRASSHGRCAKLRRCSMPIRRSAGTMRLRNHPGRGCSGCWPS